MTLSDLRSLIAYHQEMGSKLSQAAGQAYSIYGKEMAAKAALHLQWAEQLRQMLQAFETIAELTKES